MATRKYGNFNSVDQRDGENLPSGGHTVERTESEFGYTVERKDMPPRAKKEDTAEEMSRPEGWIVETAGRDVVQRDEVSAEVMEAAELSNDLLRSIATFEDAAAAVLEATGEKPLFVSESEVSDGFTMLKTDQKADLVGKPMLLVRWKFIDGSDGKYVFVSAVVKTGDAPDAIWKVHFTDGGKGIYEELKKLTDITRRTSNLVLPRGLRVSHGKYSEDLGKAVNAREAAQLVLDGKKVGDFTAYYLDTSA